MSDITLYLAAAIALVSLVLLALTYIIRRRSAAENEADAAQRPRGVPIEREGAVPPRRGGRNVRARMRIAAARQDEEEEEEDTLADEIAMPEGKIGAKKRKKLELKAEKRLQRERELEEREERKQRQQELEERRKREDEKEKEEREKQEEEERLLKEECEKKELEEYLKLKEAFSVEEEGYDEEANEEEQAHKFQEFINYIKEKKVVLLEDLAAHFKLKTQDAIDRVQELLAQEWLVGVIDDRGKFIYITKEELESVAQFMRQRGRVSISELVECSNTLINLQPDTVKPVAATS